MSEDNKGGGFFAGFIFGGLVGAALAYLITQEEARDALVGKAREAGNFAMDATGDLRGRVSDVASTLQANAADLYERGKTVVEGARTNINAAVDEGQTTANQMRDELSRQTQSLD
jgi:gas vesicle protein